ncbi:hypothetical protein BDQ17DRAFT_1326283 [Cyathus striatus]|nr:hypothetical protein BDQ17DRAFT_1326283 [Cyathus striatus]
MTEYDYSPDAYEKYLAGQQRIARWVDETQKYPPANPFLPSTAGSVTSNGGQHHTSRSPQQAYSPHGSASPQGAYAAYRPAPVSLENYAQQLITSPSSWSFQFTTPLFSSTFTIVICNTHVCSYSPNIWIHGATMYPSNTTYASNATSPNMYASNATSPTVYPSNATSPTIYSSNTSSPTIVAQSQTQPLVIQSGHGYVIVPPAGRRMEVVNPVDYTNSRSTKKDDDKPFFKKIFGGFTHSNSRRSKSTHGNSKLRRRDSL